MALRTPRLVVGLLLGGLLLLVACTPDGVEDEPPLGSGDAMQGNSAGGDPASSDSASGDSTGGDSTDGGDTIFAESYDDIAINPAEPSYELSEDEWRERLSEEEYYILRNEGTEPAFSGELLGNEREGTYHCAGCGHALFSSKARFDSKTGWPSYWEPIEEGAVGTEEDHSLGMYRVEVHCGRCGGHQGHVFPDGPQPTGLRYCINSLALDFQEAD